MDEIIIKSSRTRKRAVCFWRRHDKMVDSGGRGVLKGVDSAIAGRMVRLWRRQPERRGERPFESRLRAASEGMVPSDHFYYTEKIAEYAKRIVAEPDRAALLQFVSPESP